MSKKKRRKRRYAQPNQCQNSTNRHHLIFQGRHYASGDAKILRELFVYPLNIQRHNYLHNALLHDVPRPSDQEIKRLLYLYHDQIDYTANMAIEQACAWLIVNTEDADFKRAIMIQYDFLTR
jgi:hypothetical protein